jgi:hypothetical protein
MYSAIYSEKECYKAIEPFQGELYQTDIFQERSQLNAIRTTSEENSKFVNYREPITYRQVVKLPDAAEWEEATQKELKQFIDMKAIIPIKEVKILLSPKWFIKLNFWLMATLTSTRPDWLQKVSHKCMALISLRISLQLQ